MKLKRLATDIQQVPLNSDVTKKKTNPLYSFIILFPDDSVRGYKVLSPDMFNQEGKDMFVKFGDSRVRTQLRPTCSLLCF